jgi:tripartite motif-containing protein 71
MIIRRGQIVLFTFSTAIILFSLSLPYDNVILSTLSLLPSNSESVTQGGLRDKLTQQSAFTFCDFHSVRKFDANGNLITSWGTKGTSDGQFLHPHGIAVDKFDNIYVTDPQSDPGCSNEARISKFDSNGSFIARWGSGGSGAGQFSNRIEDVNIDSFDKVYVVDYGNNRISKFDSNGNFITMWGSKGGEEGLFDRPWGIAFDSFNNAYVTDQRNNRVQKFDSNGKFINGWGHEGEKEGEFRHLHAVAIDSNDNIYVSEGRESPRIQKFNSNGNFITSWGSQGEDNGQFKEEHGISFNSLDNIHIADSYNSRIQKFDSNGNFITSWGLRGIIHNQLLLPQDIALDSNNNAYVVDAGNTHTDIGFISKFLSKNDIMVPESC